MSLVLRNTEDTTSKIFLSFERLMTDPTQEAQSLEMFLNAECGRTDSDAVSYTAMAEAVNPELWHNRSEMPFDEIPEATPQLKNLCRFVAGKIETPSEPFHPEDFPMPPGWRQFVVTSERLARIYREKSGPTDA